MFQTELNPEDTASSLQGARAELVLKDTPDLPPLTKPIGITRRAGARMISRELAGKLGFAGFGAGGDAKQKFWLSEYLLTASQDDPRADSPYDSVIYGAGFRINIAISEVSAEAKGQIGLIAAQAQLGFVSANIDLRTIGMPAFTDVPTDLIAFKPFDAEKLQVANDAIANMSRYVETKKADLKPVPVAIVWKPSIAAARLHHADSVMFSMQRVKDRHSLTEALGIAGRDEYRDIDAGVVREVYANRLGNPSLTVEGDAGEGTKPSKQQQKDADSFLKRYDKV